MADGRKRKFIKELQQKAKLRRESGLYIADGAKMCSEIPLSELEELYATPEFLTSKYAELCAPLLKRFGCERVTEQEMKQMSDTVTPQGILAVVRQKKVKGLRSLLSGERPGGAQTGEETCRGESRAGVFESDAAAGRRVFPADKCPEAAERGADVRKAPLLMVLETIQDPGNLGTILRAAEAAGATGLLMDRGCVDIYSPKVVRSTMGAIFRVPFLVTDDLTEAARRLKDPAYTGTERGLSLYAAHLKGAVDYTAVSYREPCAILIGNEAKGLTESLTNEATGAVKIPMCGNVESLNAAMAATILLFEANRQRRLTVL